LPDLSLDLSKHTVISYQQKAESALDTALCLENTKFAQTYKETGTVFYFMRAKDEQGLMTSTLGIKY